MPFATFKHPEIGHGSLEIEYSYDPGCRGLRGSFGEPVTPDDLKELEIICARNEAGNEVDLGVHQAAAEDAILKRIQRGEL
jgi:hypothetical protein